MDSVETDGNGVFRVSWLSPGTYYLSAKRSRENDGRFAFPFLDSKGQMLKEEESETFYSSSFTFASAAPVEVKAGKNVENLVLTLKKTTLRHVSGRIGDPPRLGVLTVEEDAGSMSIRVRVIPIGDDGSFSLGGLPPGRYRLALGDAHRRLARKDVDLTNGDADGIVLEQLENVDVPSNT